MARTSPSTPQVEPPEVGRCTFGSSLKCTACTLCTESKFQYLLTACEPYETIAFKAIVGRCPARPESGTLQVPNMEIDKAENKFFTSWDPQRKVFTMQAPCRHVPAGTLVGLSFG